MNIGSKDNYASTRIFAQLDSIAISYVEFQTKVADQSQLKQLCLKNCRVGEFALHILGDRSEHFERKIKAFTAKANPHQTRVLTKDEKEEIKQVVERCLCSRNAVINNCELAKLDRIHSDQRKAYKEETRANMQRIAEKSKIDLTSDTLYNFAVNERQKELMFKHCGTIHPLTEAYMTYKEAYVHAFLLKN